MTSESNRTCACFSTAVGLTALGLAVAVTTVWPNRATADSIDPLLHDDSRAPRAEPLPLSVTEDELLPRLPVVEGDNLERQTLRLPEDLEGDLNLVFIAFRRSQQAAVDTWLPFARDLAAVHPGLRYYELPTISKRGPISRFFINEGMRRGIPDPVARRTTITLYLDKGAFREALDIPHEDEIQVMLVDREGRIHWRVEGVMSEQAAADLERLVEARLAPGERLARHDFPEGRDAIR